VLFEMLSGQRLFAGETISDTLAAVLRQDIDWNLLPPGLPAELTRLLRRCLERDQRNRLHDIGDARIVLEEIARGGTAADAPAPIAMAQPARLAWLTAVIAVAMLGAGLLAGRWVWSERGPATPAAPLARMVTFAPAGVDEVPRLVMASDGSFVVFVGVSGNTQQLYLRRLDDIAPRPIEHTEGADRPILSPDNKWIGFSRANHLEKVSVSGSEAVQIAEVPSSNPGHAWGPGDTILITTNWYGGMSAVSANGGDIRKVTTLDTAHGEKGHWFPQFLPDGRHVIFTIWKAAGGLNDSQIAVLDMASGTYKVIMSGAHGSYVAPGFLVFYRAGAYHAVRFDLASLTPSGDPVMVLTEDRGIMPDGSNPSLSVSANGTVAYVPGQYYPASTLTWVAEGGKTESLGFDARSHVSAELSPQGHQIAAGLVEGGRYVIRVLDLDRHTDQPLELSGSNWAPVWHPDGRRIAMRSMLKGNFDIYAKDITTSAAPVLLLANPGDETPMAWLSEKTLVISQEGGDGTYRAKLLDMNAPDRPTVLSEYNPDAVSVSLDHQWIAIANGHTGRSEIYVRRISGDGIPEPVTANGGSAPVFLRNGHDLLYVRGQDIIAVSWRDEGGRFKTERERVWAHLSATLPLGIFAADPDGRVLVGVRKDATIAPQIRIILNWQEELARKLAR
jgi:serine/threonine-protein kinase